MYRAFSSSLLSLLLAATFLWGGCVSCEQYFMFGGEKSCCAADGHCRTTQTPAQPGSGSECKQIAFDHHQPGEYHVDLPVSALTTIPLSLQGAETIRQRASNPVAPSPPDLQVLHSTFLI